MIFEFSCQFVIYWKVNDEIESEWNALEKTLYIEKGHKIQQNIILLQNDIWILLLVFNLLKGKWWHREWMKCTGENLIYRQKITKYNKTLSCYKMLFEFSCQFVIY